MKIKNYFLDNNVIIGFIYKLDNLNPDSENIVNSGNNLYYSMHRNLRLFNTFYSFFNTFYNNCYIFVA